MAIFFSLYDQYRIFKQRQKFYNLYGYRLDLENPRSFNEKIIWRKVFDRNPLFPLLQDKYKARGYVVDKLGKEEGEGILVPLLFVTEDPDEIPFDDLPEEYIIKPNHGSGWHIIVEKGNPARPKEIVSKCRKWLRKTYGRSRMEWAYSSIAPLIMVEKLLKDSQGDLVPDFKFHVFNGRIEWVFILNDRFGEPSGARYDINFNRMDSSFSKYNEATEIIKPQGFEKMVDIAERLAGSLDYVRVDMYNVDGKIYFGEFTIYPSSGLNKMDRAMDLYMGRKLELDLRFARFFHHCYKFSI